MNNSNDIKKILEDKLDAYESPVRPELWQNISSQIATGPIAGGSSSVFIGIVAKLIIAAASFAAVIGATYYFTNSEEISLVEKQETKQEVSTENPISSEKNSQNDTTNTVEESHSTTATSSEESNSSIHENNTETAPTSKSDGDVLSDPLMPPIHSREQKKPEMVTPPTSDKSNDSSQLEQNKVVEIDPITATFSIKASDPERLRYFMFSSDIGNLTYTWTINNAVKSHENNFSIQFEEQGEYEVTLKVENSTTGETAETSEIIKAFKPIRFEYPNAFSPGKNGLNDRIDFDDLCKNKEKLLSVTISDLNGNTIYYSENNFSWDGRDVQGSICPQGSYIYSVTAIDKFGQAQGKNGRIQLFLD